MKIIDQEAYQNWKDKNTDPYGNACFVFAEAWAELMEIRIEKGERVCDIAQATSNEVEMGITGFMYGMAVRILSHCWEHGEALRKWHNKEYGHEGEGVVNPAIFTIG